MGACDGRRTPRALGPFVDIASTTGGGLREVVENGKKPTACFAALVGELAEESPSIIVLEDVHWADEATPGRARDAGGAAPRSWTR
jgi:hypothetical protein